MGMKTTIATFILLLCAVTIHAQPPNTDSIGYRDAIAAAKDLYLQYMGKEAPIFNGPVSRPFNYTLSEGSQYFIPIQNPAGKVVYNGLMYTDVPLLFDVLNNKLITRKPSDNQAFEIQTSHVSHFELDKHRFTYLQTSLAKNMPAGFYEILYEGKKNSVYEMHTKLLNEELGEKFKKYVIEDNSIFYIKKGGAYYKVEKKKNLYQIYNNHEAEIKSFIKNNQLNVSKNTAAALIEIAGYFETL